MNNFLPEFRLSAIPDRLTLANVRWIDGDYAVQILAEVAIAQVQNVTSYATEPAKRILQRYEFAAAGGWVAWGCQLDGSAGEVALFKPLKPRVSAEFKGFGDKPKEKVIKYETPAKCDAVPMLPYVDGESAERIYARWQFRPVGNETFWQAVQRSGAPIAIVEGYKKALALIAHGIPAIAVRGVTQWRVKGTDDLHPVIGQFVAAKRSFYLAFDQDAPEKRKTIKNVRQQVLKLGNSIDATGAIARVLTWSHATGKGIDDALYNKGAQAQFWLDERLNDAWSVREFKREGGLFVALEAIRRQSESAFPVERATEGEYLPQLPELQQGAIHCLAATMGSGKTVRIGADWVAQARSPGWVTLVLAPLNSLGMQTAKDWGLPHIHDFGFSAEQQRALWGQVSHEQGIVMCPDSLHRLPDWFLSKPILLVLDEANQVIHHAVHGATLGDRWSDILGKLGTIAKHAAATGAIVLSEDGLPDRAINFMQRVSGAETVQLFRHKKQSAPWPVTIASSAPSGFRKEFLAAAKDKRLLFVSSSQAECRRMEMALNQRFADKKIVRIDSQTNELGAFDLFFQNPDKWLEAEQPDVVLLSPSGKTGVSIQGGVSAENAYFSEVWGYFSALDSSSHMQLLGRFRPSVPRVVYCPEFITNTDDSGQAWAIAEKWRKNADIFSRLYAIESVVEGHDETAQAIEAAAIDYLSQQLEFSGLQKAFAHGSLRYLLQCAGHQVTEKSFDTDKGISETWKSIQDCIWQQDADELAAAPIVEATHTPDWAYRVLNAIEASQTNRAIARKVLLRCEFPGVAFDCPDFCYQAITSDYGRLRRGVQLQARAENLAAAKELDRKSTEAILNGKIRAFHKLPRNYTRAWLLHKVGILQLLDGKPYHNKDDRAIAIKKAALQLADQIKYWLRLEVKEEQTPVEVCNKLLRKLGLEKEKGKEGDPSWKPGEIVVTRPGKRGQQSDRHYQVDLSLNPTRAELLQSAQSKLSESVSTICNSKENIYMQIVDTSQNTPPDQGDAGGCAGELDPDSLADIRQMWGDVELRAYLVETFGQAAIDRAIAA